MPLRPSQIVVASFVFALLLALAGCGRSSPLLRAGTPLANTPKPGTEATGSPVVLGGTPISADTIGKGTIRFANPGDNRTAFEDTLAGYIVVWGYGYSAELVDTKDIGNQKAFDDGLVDVIMEVDKVADATWYKARAGEGKLVDAGSVLGPGSTKRIVVQPAFKQSSPELVEFLGKMSMDEARLNDSAGKITTGRIGTSPAVATLIFFKAEDTSWTAWMPPPVLEGVQAAIERGKASLRNRDCIPLGNEGGATTMRCRPD